MAPKASASRIARVRADAVIWSDFRAAIGERSVAEVLGQETPEGHAVRFDSVGRVTHVTAINAK